MPPSSSPSSKPALAAAGGKAKPVAGNKALAQHARVLEAEAKRREWEGSADRAALTALCEQSEAASAAVQALCRLPADQADPMLRAGFAAGLPMESAALVAAEADRPDLLETIDSLGVSLTDEPHPFFRNRLALPATPLMAAADKGRLSAALFLQARGASIFADGRAKRKNPLLGHSFAPPLSATPSLGAAPVELAVLRGFAPLAQALLEQEAKKGPLPQAALDRLAGAVALAGREWVFSAQDCARLTPTEMKQIEERLILAEAFLSSANLAMAPGDETNVSATGRWALASARMLPGQEAPPSLMDRRGDNLERRKMPLPLLVFAAQFRHASLRPLSQALARGLDLAAADRLAPDGVGALASVSLFADLFKNNALHVGWALLDAGAPIHAPSEGPWVCPWLMAFFSAAAAAHDHPWAIDGPPLLSLAQKILETADRRGAPISRESLWSASDALARELTAMGRAAADPSDRERVMDASNFVGFKELIQTLADATQGSGPERAWRVVLQSSLFTVPVNDSRSVSDLRNGSFVSRLEAVALAVDLDRSLGAQSEAPGAAGRDLAPSRPPRRV